MSGIAGPTNPAWHEGQFGTQPGSSRNEGHQGELREEQEKIKQQLQMFVIFNKTDPALCL